MVNNYMEPMKLFLNKCRAGLDMGILFKWLSLFLADSVFYFPM